MSVDVDTNGKIRVYLVGRCEGLDDVRTGLPSHGEIELVGSSPTAADARPDLSGWDVDVILYATEGPSLALDELDEIREQTVAPIILLAEASSPHPLEEALAADVADALLLPQPAEGVIFAIHKATGRREARAPSALGHVFTVFSPKGGTGKTVTATNLAAAFASCRELRTLLVDLDLQFGDAATALGLEPEQTIYDLLTAPGELDAEKLHGYTTHHDSGVEVVAAPALPEEAELISLPKLVRLLEVAREAYDVVIVDTGPFLHGPILTAIDHTDRLLLMATLDVPTLRSVRQSLQTLDLISFPSERVAMVLNRATAQAGLKRGDVEAALDVRIRFTIPDDPAAQLAVNRGAPALVVEPRSEFSQSIRQLADSLLSEASTGRGSRVAVGRA